MMWSKYKVAYINAFEKMLDDREKSGTKPRWRQGGSDYKNATGMDVFNWWMEDENLIGQINLFEDYEEDEYL